MAITTDIVATYKGPRRVMRRLLDGPQREDRAIMFLMLACALIFVAQWPRLRREAFFDVSVPSDVEVPDAVADAANDPFMALLGGALFGWIFIAPLAFYVIALVSHWIARAVGGQGSSYGARLALFWSLLAATPLWLLYGLMSGMLGATLAVQGVGAIAFGVFLLFWLLTLYEAEAGT